MCGGGGRKSKKEDLTHYRSKIMVEIKDTNQYYVQGLSSILQEILPAILKSVRQAEDPKVVLISDDMSILNHYCLKDDDTPVFYFSLIDKRSRVIHKSCSHECGVIYKQDTIEEVVDKVKRVILSFYKDPSEFKRKFHNDCYLKSITSQEARILNCIKNGFSPKEIADILKISIKTVSTHKQKVMGKLSFSRNMDLVDWLRKGGVEYISNIRKDGI
ncbi:hypothetical protein B7L32_22990 [Serratia marcescens]|nr:hypothetical protein B7L32_22990 [Serratia marcescens]